MASTENPGAQIREVSEVGYQLEKSAEGMLIASRHASEAGDREGAARELTVAAREYEWAARVWDALGQIARSRNCREMSAKAREPALRTEPTP